MADDDRYQQLHPSVVGLWRAQVVVAMLVLAAAALVPVAILTLVGKITTVVPLVIVAAAIVATSVCAIWFVAVAYRHWSFRIQDNGTVQIRRGVVFTREIHVPMGRVQHVDIEQGPVERRFRLVRLILFTAGSKDARQVIPGLRDDAAEALRAKLAHIAHPQQRDA